LYHWSKSVNFVAVLKKVFVAILAVLYLAVASGVEMNIHYCMGKIASVEYGASEKGLCGKCGMQSKKGCCEDETRFLRLQDSHQLSQLSWAFQLPVTITSPLYSFVASSGARQEVLIHEHANGPPLNTATPIYLLNCNYRI
jgi:hypothetical protein